MDGLCEGMVCVEGYNKWSVLHIIIPSHKPPLHTNQMICNTNHLFFSVLHLFTQTIHTNQKITQTIHSHKPDNHTNQIICNTENEKWFVWKDGLCEGMVCVKRCNTENDKWFVWRDLSTFFDYLVCVNKCFVWRDGLCKWMVILCITSLHKTFIHTNQIIKESR